MMLRPALVGRYYRRARGSHLIDDSGFRRERRTVYRRPQNGDLGHCPTCGDTSAVRARHRFGGKVVPAWVCAWPNCRPRIVRPTMPSTTPESLDVARAAKDVQASARRTAMKSRAAVV